MGAWAFFLPQVTLSLKGIKVDVLGFRPAARPPLFNQPFGFHCFPSHVARVIKDVIFSFYKDFFFFYFLFDFKATFLVKFRVLGYCIHLVIGGYWSHYFIDILPLPTLQHTPYAWIQLSFWCIWFLKIHVYLNLCVGCWLSKEPFLLWGATFNVEMEYSVMHHLQMWKICNFTEPDCSNREWLAT